MAPQSQSDWAKLGLALRNGKLLPIKENLASPSEQTLVAPTSRNVDKTDDKDGDDDDDDHASGSFSPSRLTHYE